MNAKETDSFTLKFNKTELKVLARMADELLVHGVVVTKGISDEDETALRNTRDMMQKQLDFPDMKF